MPEYTPADLIRARRPHADAYERGDAACTLGHLEVEQREAPTSERAAIIAEVEAHIAAFDSGSAPTTSASPPPGDSLPVRPTQATPPTASTATNAPACGLQAGIAASTSSMQRILRAQGITPASEPHAAAGIGTTSMARTLRRMGLPPRAGG